MTVFFQLSVCQKDYANTTGWNFIKNSKDRSWSKLYLIKFLERSRSLSGYKKDPDFSIYLSPFVLTDVCTLLVLLLSHYFWHNNFLSDV